MNTKKITTISLTILAIIVIAGGVWYAQKPSPEAPSADNGTGQAVDNSGDSVADDGTQDGGIDTSDDNIEIIEIDKVDHQSDDWMIYENTRFRYRIALPNGFTHHDEYYGTETEFPTDGYGFNAWKDGMGIVSSGDKRFVLYQGRDEVTDDWQKLVNEVDNKFYQIGSNKFVKRSNFTDEKYFNTTNDRYMISFEFTNIDKRLKAQILNSFEFIN